MRRALKWLLWIALAFLVYAIFSSPEQAAEILVDAVEGIGRAFGGIFTFFEAMLSELGQEPATTPTTG